MIKGGWHIKEGRCKFSSNGLCPNCNKVIKTRHRKKWCVSCGRCFHNNCCKDESFTNVAKDENGKTGPICIPCWSNYFYDTNNFDQTLVENGYSGLDKACLPPEEFELLKQAVLNNDMKECNSIIDNMEGVGEPATDKELKKIDEKILREGIMKNLPKVKAWFKATMDISEKTEKINIVEDPMGNYASMIAYTKNKLYLVKPAEGLNKEIFNSIKGHSRGISPELYNIGKFRIPLDIIASLHAGFYPGPEDLKESQSAYYICFEFKKMTDWFDAPDEDKRDEAIKELRERSKSEGTHTDSPLNTNNNIVIDINKGSYEAYFIDMGDFNFLDELGATRGAITKKKKTRRKKKKVSSNNRYKKKKDKKKKNNKKKKTRRKKK